MTVVIRCAVCHSLHPPVGDPPHVCSECVMIAEGRTYEDGSDPAEELSRAEIDYIRLRVSSAHRIRAAVQGKL